MLLHVHAWVLSWLDCPCRYAPTLEILCGPSLTCVAPNVAACIFRVRTVQHMRKHAQPLPKESSRYLILTHHLGFLVPKVLEILRAAEIELLRVV